MSSRRLTIHLGMLEQLSYRNIDARYEQLKEAHKKTFNWVFMDLNHGFVDWLCNRDGTFWISGNAAAGKSTLMKYIYDDPRTEEYLKQWAGTDELLIARFFFNDQGLAIQKNTDGLLRSTLLQILRARRQLIPHVFPERWADAWSIRKMTGHDPPEYLYSSTELCSAFEHIGQQEVKGLKFCIFIDGLDEYSGSPEDVIASINNIVSSSNGQRTQMKACVSSRPYTSFQQAFKDCLHLKVHELTKDDITQYVADRLQEYYDESAGPSHQHFIDQLISGVTEKAAGVFLWVQLVPDLLMEGLRDGDTEAELNNQLESLPPRLEGLYTRMTQKIKPEHLGQAASIISMLVHKEGGIRTIKLSFAEQGPESALTLRPAEMSSEERRRIQARMSNRMTSRCAGLVTVVTEKSAWLWKDEKGAETVMFLHKTVKDFLTELKTCLI